MSLAANVCLLLSEWISFLLVAVPPRSRRTFVELLIGCLLNPEGWVTRAIGAIRREAHWTTYYKLIERAQVPVTELSLRLLQLVLRVCPTELVTPDPRRYAGSALREVRAGDQHQTRSQPQGQSADVFEQPVLGHAGLGRASPAGFGADGTNSLLAARRIGAARQALGGTAIDGFDPGGT
jgi:hypothetical protein